MSMLHLQLAGQATVGANMEESNMDEILSIDTGASIFSGLDDLQNGTGVVDESDINVKLISRNVSTKQ